MDKQAGFTLLEMLAVMSVIALIVGGIFTGRSMIRNAQIQNILTEYQQYATAIQNFQSKYQAMPGDFLGATQLWGSWSICINGMGSGTATGTLTCDGEGEGYIEIGYLRDHIRAWRHLGLAGFISGNYSGTAVTGVCTVSPFSNVNITPGQNVPASKLAGAGWNIAVSTYSATPYSTGVAGVYVPMDPALDRTNEHFLRIGGTLQDDNAIATFSCAQSQVPMLTAEEAYQIDIKNDDGAVTTGRVRGMYNNATYYNSCNSGSSTTGGYNITAAGMNCALAFKLD
jgi:prepilin-type N-terminal cleavage/methylation domain-containing protein